MHETLEPEEQQLLCELGNFVCCCLASLPGKFGPIYFSRTMIITRPPEK